MNIDDLLNDWQDAKIKRLVYEKKCERYKKSIDKYMKKKGISAIKGQDTTVTKRTIARDIISKTDVPADVWKNYSRRINYNAFYLTKNK